MIARTSSPPLRGEEPALSTTMVLVSSPDEGLRAQIRLTLGDDRFAITEAPDTDDAIRAVAAEVPDLAILDAQLPGAGALALARTLRGQPETAEVRTLLLVQRGEDATVVEGVDATMAVPMTSFALLRRVGALLEGEDHRADGDEPADGDGPGDGADADVEGGGQDPEG
jgi:DNA-binding response OmpR family regulator